MIQAESSIAYISGYLFVILASANSTFGDVSSVTVPNLATGSGSGVPFSISTGNSLRYQQVFSSSAFSSFNKIPHLITGIYFSAESSTGVYGVISNLRVDLSTTQSAPDRLSSIFATNVGTDDQIVFDGPWTIHSVNGETLDILMPFSKPFVYDPSKGNLLLDVRNLSGGQTIYINGANIADDQVSRMYSHDVFGNKGEGDSFGLIAKFVIAPVPEPSSLGILILPALWMLRRLKKIDRD